MCKREPERAVASHRNSTDGTTRLSGLNAVLALDVRDELLQKKIVVANRAVGRVDVEAATAFRRDDQKVAHLVLAAKIVEQSPAPAVEQSLLVIAEAVQKIKHRIAPLVMLRPARVIACRQIDAVMNNLLQDAAFQSAAIDPALGRGRDPSA